MSSMGKYKTHLYYKGDDTYSSVCGGITTLIIVFSLVVYGGYIISTISDKKYYELDAET